MMDCFGWINKVEFELNFQKKQGEKMKFFSKIQIFGVALATCVALSLTACGESKGGGENKEQSKEQSKEENKEQNKEESKEQGKEQNKEESKKENSQLSAYVKKQCPQCVFVVEGRYEAFDVGFPDVWECKTAVFYRRYATSYAREIERLDALQVRVDKRFKIETTLQAYKVRDDYQPEDKWEQRVFAEYAITLLSMPEGVKKVAVGVSGGFSLEGFLEDFTAPQQTQKVYNVYYDGRRDIITGFETSIPDEDKRFCIHPHNVKQNNANETPNTQNADEVKTSTNEQSPATEQIKPSFDCAKASTSAEKLVCSDNELANLDNELSKAYTNARNLLDNAGKKELTSEQKAWLETHNQCADKECVKQSLQKRIELLKSTDMRIYLATKDEFVNLRKSPNGEILTPIYKKDFDKIILKRLGVEDKWLKVLYFPPNVSDEKEALTGYIHNSQIK